jgi:hypothetical protein
MDIDGDVPTTPIVTNAALEAREAARRHARDLIARAERVEALRLAPAAAPPPVNRELAVVSSSSADGDYTTQLAAAQDAVSRNPARRPYRLGERDATAGYLPASAMRRSRKPKRPSDESSRNEEQESVAPTGVLSTAMVVHEEEPVLPPATKRSRLPPSAPTTAEDDGL